MFILNNDGTVPLYKQLYRQIREHVLSGKLPTHVRVMTEYNSTGPIE